MKSQRHRSELAPGQTYDQLVTDSVILSEEYVESAINDDRGGASNPHSAAQGILTGLILSLVIWALILLPFLLF